MLDFITAGSEVQMTEEISLGRILDYVDEPKCICYLLILPSPFIYKHGLAMVYSVLSPCLSFEKGRKTAKPKLNYIEAKPLGQ